jgi:hypothetical protein
VSEFLDELARSLANPMPRRRALRLIGGAVVTTTAPALFPRKAFARAQDCNAFGAGGTPMAVLIDARGRIATPLAAGEDAFFGLVEHR